MKTFTLLSIALLFSFIANAQMIDFDNVGFDYVWNEMSNTGIAPVVTVNPVSDDVNNSDSVLFIDIQQAGDPWAGTWCDIPEFEVKGNGIIRMKVLKSIISEVGFKIEAGTGENKEIKIANTLTNEWEIIEYDFSELIGETYPRIVLMPEFTESREENSECYLDDIEFFTQQSGIASMYKASFQIYASNNKVAFKGIDQVEDVEIFNLAGKLVVSQKSDAIRTVEISKLKKGIYVVKARSGKEIAIAKIIKQ